MSNKQWIPGADDRYINAAFNVVEMPTELEPEGATSLLHLLPWGETTLKDAALREMFGDPGVVLVDDASADMVKINFGASPIDLHVNLDHRHLGEGQAVGWITQIYADKEMGLGVEVDWTKEGRALIKSKAYRYASGEFSLDRQTGRVVAIAGAALTNKPAADQGMRPVKLSLVTADNEPLQPARKGHQRSTDMDIKAYFARLTGRTIDDDGDAVVVASDLHKQAQKADTLAAELSTSRDEVAALTISLSEMTERAETAESAAADQATKARVDAALASGQISPAQEEWAAGQTEEAFAVYLSTVEPGTYTPPKRVVKDPDTNEPVSNLAEGSSKDARAAQIKAYSKSEDITFAQAAVVLGRKGAN